MHRPRPPFCKVAEFWLVRDWQDSRSLFLEQAPGVGEAKTTVVFDQQPVTIDGKPVGEANVKLLPDGSRKATYAGLALGNAR